LTVINKTEATTKTRSLLRSNSALAAVPDAAFIVDIQEMRIIYTNHAAAQMLKVASAASSSLEPIVGRIATEILPVLADHLQILPTRGETPDTASLKWYGRSELVCVDGEKMTVDVHITTMPPVDQHDEGPSATLTSACQYSKSRCLTRLPCVYLNRSWIYCGFCP
jgi:PAS domain-containing protein